ncbi:MAG: NAD(P)/FAD-dependent oxidoreductase [Dermatophilaceae bacterium]
MAVVGAGFTGLWAAVLALEEEDSGREVVVREVVVREVERLGWAATGRNGGLCAASLTHGVTNGLARWPGEMPLLQRLGAANLDAIEATIRERGIDCDFERTGELEVALEPWQLEELGSLQKTRRALGQEVELLSAAQTRALVDSPTYRASECCSDPRARRLTHIPGGLLDRHGVAMANPARLAWGLADAVEGAGGRIHEATRVRRLRSAGERVALTTATGTVRARQVVLATNVFPSPLRRARAYVVPVWDHILVTEPLSSLSPSR